MPQLVTYSDVDTNIFTTNQASGGSGGTKKSFIKIDKGAIMTKLSAWKYEWRLRGVEMFMSDGSRALFGTRAGKASSFTLSIGERLTTLNIQASGETSTGGKHRLGAIWLKTNRGREWGIFSDWLKEDGRFWPDVGSGIVCGMFGSAGDDVDNLGFALLQPVKDARLVNVTYPNLDLEVVASAPTTVANKTFTNGTSAEQEYVLEGKRSITIKRGWSLTTAFEQTLETSVTAGVPEVAEGTVTASWTVGVAANYSRETEDTEERTWTWTIKCPPHKKIHATGTMYSDDIDIDYTAKMKVKLQNGHEYEYDVEGIYEGANVRSGNFEIQELGDA